MRSKAVILVLLFAFLFIPLVHAENSVDWYERGQNAAMVGNYADALTYYNNALALDKNYPAALSGKAVALNGLGEYAEAVNVSVQALAIVSADQNALNARAYGLFKLGRYEEAVAAYDKLFTVETNRFDAYCNQGYAYLMMNKSDTAITSYDRCLAIDPINIDAWNRKGLSFMALGNYPDALKAFDSATSITSTNPDLWNNKGLAFAAMGKYQDARQCFTKALALKPDFSEAQKNKDSLTGKQEIVNISGTPPTPAVTINRIGTFYTTATPIPQLTGDTTMQEQATDQGPSTTVPVAKQTTYSPLSPLIAFGAVAVVCGFVCAMQRARK